MAANDSVDPATWLAEQIEHGDPDLLRSMVKTMAETPVSAEADGVCDADYGERSEELTNRRNGYRSREWDTRAVTTEQQSLPPPRRGLNLKQVGAWIDETLLARGWLQVDEQALRSGTTRLQGDEPIMRSCMREDSSGWRACWP